MQDESDDFVLYEGDEVQEAAMSKWQKCVRLQRLRFKEGASCSGPLSVVSGPSTLLELEMRAPHGREEGRRVEEEDGFARGRSLVRARTSVVGRGGRRGIRR